MKKTTRRWNWNRGFIIGLFDYYTQLIISSLSMPGPQRTLDTSISEMFPLLRNLSTNTNLSLTIHAQKRKKWLFWFSPSVAETIIIQQYLGKDHTIVIITAESSLEIRQLAEHSICAIHPSVVNIALFYSIHYISVYPLGAIIWL